MKVLFFCNSFLLHKELRPTYPPGPEALQKGVWSGGEPLCEGEDSCKVQVTWLSLYSSMCDVQRMALLDELAS